MDHPRPIHLGVSQRTLARCGEQRWEVELNVKADLPVGIGKTTTMQSECDMLVAAKSAEAVAAKS